MSRARHIPQQLVLPIVVALTAGVVLVLSAAYSAQGSSHGTTYWACLYAGSLSQVGTTEPTNCGRGTAIHWTSVETLGPAGVNTTNVRTGFVVGDSLSGEDATLQVVSPGTYRISYPPGTFPKYDGAALDGMPIMTFASASGSTTPQWSLAFWGDDGSWYTIVETDGAPSNFSFVVTQHIPADAVFSTAPFGAQSESIIISVDD